jgi:DNA-binding transcriptional LysR family regulator
LLPDFFAQYPTSRSASVSDQRIDPISEMVDVTIRVGPLADSELIAVRLGEVRRVIAASPHYLAANGTPQKPADLLRHNCLLLSGLSRLSQWPLFENSKRVLIAAKGNVTSDSAELLLDLALAGTGILRLGDFLGESALTQGQLIPLLADCHDDDPQPITALLLPDRQSIPRVRALVDFLKARL